MPTHRFWLYICAFFGAVIFYYFYIGWFARFLIIVLIILPVISILCSVPGMKSAQILLSSPKYSVQGGNVDFEVSVSSQSGFPFGKTRIFYEVTNIFTCDQFLKRRIKLKGAPASEIVTVVNADKCGCIIIDVKKIRVYDFLGIISIPKRPSGSAMTAVLPLFPSPEPENTFSDEADRRLVPKRGGGFSEEYELREYQPGDAITSIHWKLTSKLGKAIIREAMIPEQGDIFVTVELGDDPVAAASNLYWLCRVLTEGSTEYTLLWSVNNAVTDCRVESLDDISRSFAMLMSSSASDIKPVVSHVGLETFLVSDEEVKRL